MNFAQQQNKKKNVHSRQAFKKPGQASHGRQGASSSNPPNNSNEFPVPYDTCLHCKKQGHYKRQCPDFLRMLLEQGKDQVTFIDESLYLEFSTNSWWIDSGATVHVANSLQGFRTSQRLPRGQRTIRVANEIEAPVEAIGELPLELANGFVLLLRDVLFVPSLRRNL